MKNTGTSMKEEQEQVNKKPLMDGLYLLSEMNRLVNNLTYSSKTFNILSSYDGIAIVFEVVDEKTKNVVEVFKSSPGLATQSFDKLVDKYIFDYDKKLSS